MRLFHQTDNCGEILRQGFRPEAVAKGTGIPAGRISLPGVYLKKTKGMVRPDVIGTQQAEVEATISKPITFNSWDDFHDWQRERGIDVVSDVMYLIDRHEPGSDFAKKLQEEHNTTVSLLKQESHDAVIIRRDKVPRTKQTIETTVVLNPSMVKPIKCLPRQTDLIEKMKKLQEEREYVRRESARRVGWPYVPGRVYGQWGFKQLDAITQKEDKLFREFYERTSGE